MNIYMISSRGFDSRFVICSCHVPVDPLVVLVCVQYKIYLLNLIRIHQKKLSHTVLDY